MFVSRQLGQPMPCLLHVSLACASEAVPSVPEQAAEIVTDYDEPYAFGQLRPTVDRLGPFSLREYVRLQLLRTRIQDSPSAMDQPAARPTRARSLSRR
jgi:hypothetical protein